MASLLSPAITPATRLAPCPSPSPSPSPAGYPLPGACKAGPLLRAAHLRQDLSCRAISKHKTHDYSLDVNQNGLYVEQWQDRYVELDKEAPEAKDVPRMIEEVKAMLATMTDGEISVSAYDTAWVALVRSLDGSDRPQFPSALQWISENQLPDGSWGEDTMFSAHDRLINTLACVIALKSWSLSPEKCEKGLIFFRNNLWRLAEEEEIFMTVGFEITFPSLLELAKDLELEVPYDDPVLQDIYAKKEFKMKRIPKEVLHKIPTTLLHSLEGMPGLDWSKLMQLQAQDGSFLFSPASTAYALMQTGDEKCLSYLEKILEKFNGGVPNVYPVDLFENVWVVDRLERLGIARYFEDEIKRCIDYLSRYWDDEGICWARNTNVRDVDDTSMAFRLLRLHGYHVTTGAFKNFEKDEEFCCFIGQSNQSVTGMYNLNRASQVMFEGEDILERGRRFSCRFLREKLAANELKDKWIITKDLTGEVEYALDFPLFASLPRVEARLFLEQYGGVEDIWIGKTLYRMPFVNNNLYLELAKSDFNQCQQTHQVEWLGLQKWYAEIGLAASGMSPNSVLRHYFLAASSIFEPSRSAERLAWARTAVVAEAVAKYLNNEDRTPEEKRELINHFTNGHARSGRNRTSEWLVGPLLHLIDHLATRTSQEHQKRLRQQLRQAWEEWMLTWTDGDDGGSHRAGGDPAGLLLVQTIEACAGRSSSGEPSGHPAYDRLARLISSISGRLSLHRPPSEVQVNRQVEQLSMDNTTKSEMRELIECVLQSSDGLDSKTKQTFLTVAKSYCYSAQCPSATLDSHISKVLFERVV